MAKKTKTKSVLNTDLDDSVNSNIENSLISNGALNDDAYIDTDAEDPIIIGDKEEEDSTTYDMGTITFEGNDEEDDLKKNKAILNDENNDENDLWMDSEIETKDNDDFSDEDFDSDNPFKDDEY